VTLANAALSRKGKIRFSEFDQLSPPVARYFRFALTNGQTAIRVARFSQRGEFRIDPKTNRRLTYHADGNCETIIYGGRETRFFEVEKAKFDVGLN
jgi:hypothetical protein